MLWQLFQVSVPMYYTGVNKFLKFYPTLKGLNVDNLFLHCWVTYFSVFSLSFARLCENERYMTWFCECRDARFADRLEYNVQVQLRFCVVDSSCRQPDCFPSGIGVKVNNMPATLPVRRLRCYGTLFMLTYCTMTTGSATVFTDST